MSRSSHFVACLLVMTFADRAFSGDLDGRVVQDHSGAAVGSAEVRVLRAGDRVLIADLESDSQGRFQAAGLAAGRYRIEISKSNFVGVEAEVRVAAEGATAAVVRMVRHAVITGQAFDQDGRPLAGARVRAIRQTTPGVLRVTSAGSWPKTAAVDEQGRYRLTGLAPGAYVVALTFGASTDAMGMTGNAMTRAVAGSGYQLYPSNAKPMVFQIEGGEEQAGIDFALPLTPLGEVRGKLELPAGQQGGRFWVALTPADQTGLAVAVTEADRDGTFHFSGVPGGAYHVLAAGPTTGRGPRGAILGNEPWFGRTQIQTGPQDVEGVAVAMEKGRQVTLQLKVDPAATGCAAAAEVTLAALEDWGSDVDRHVTVRIGGPTVVRDLTPARYQVSVRQEGGACYGAAETTLNAGAVETVELRLAEAGKIRGRLASAKGGEVVVLSGDAAVGTVRSVTPGEDGSFQFSGLAPGRYRVAARAAGGRVRWIGSAPGAQEVQVQPGKTVEVMVEVAAEEQ